MLNDFWLSFLSTAAIWSGFSPRAKRSHIFLYSISMPIAYSLQLNSGLSERAFQTLALVAFKLAKIKN